MAGKSAKGLSWWSIKNGLLYSRDLRKDESVREVCSKFSEEVSLKSLQDQMSNSYGVMLLYHESEESGYVKFYCYDPMNTPSEEFASAAQEVMNIVGSDGCKIVSMMEVFNNLETVSVWAEMSVTFNKGPANSWLPIMWFADEDSPVDKYFSVDTDSYGSNLIESSETIGEIGKSIAEMCPPIDLEFGDEDRYVTIEVNKDGVRKKIIYNTNNIAYNGNTKYAYAFKSLVPCLNKDAFGKFDVKSNFMGFAFDMSDQFIMCYDQSTGGTIEWLNPDSGLNVSSMDMPEGEGIVPSLDALGKLMK